MCTVHARKLLPPAKGSHAVHLLAGTAALERAIKEKAAVLAELEQKYEDAQKQVTAGCLPGLAEVVKIFRLSDALTP